MSRNQSAEGPHSKIILPGTDFAMVGLEDNVTRPQCVSRRTTSTVRQRVGDLSVVLLISCCSEQNGSVNDRKDAELQDERTTFDIPVINFYRDTVGLRMRRPPKDASCLRARDLKRMTLCELRTTSSRLPKS